jgi:hypothetical protein
MYLGITHLPQDRCPNQEVPNITFFEAVALLLVHMYNQHIVGFLRGHHHTTFWDASVPGVDDEATLPTEPLQSGSVRPW